LVAAAALLLRMRHDFFSVFFSVLFSLLAFHLYFAFGGAVRGCAHL
jgi:hypothetical protein